MTIRLLSCAPLLLGALLCPLTLSAAPQGREEAINQLVDRAIPPERIADAIVDFVPRAYMPLHIASPNKRTIEGDVVKLERGPAQFLERTAAQVPSIVHPANTLIAPLKPGVPVKLFLKQDPKTSDYYVIAILPISYTYGEKP